MEFIFGYMLGSSSHKVNLAVTAQQEYFASESGLLVILVVLLAAIIGSYILYKNGGM